MKLNKWSLFFLFLLLCDIAYTFFQNYCSMTIDGDLTAIIMPAEGYRKVLEDPFGLGVLINNDFYAGTNRFFIHWFLKLYFHNLPFFFQNYEFRRKLNKGKQ